LKSSTQSVAALDGIRAIAIIAVIAYHMNPNLLTGGFLGVDIFFVLSGYLITWILLDRFVRLGKIDFKGFYLARARRLLPAFIFMIFVILVFVALWAPDTIERFLTDLPWASVGLSNWWFIFMDYDYFAQLGRPSLLQHTWSLAIEAQFYALWPLMIAALAPTLMLKRMQVLAIAGAVASWFTLVWVATAGVNSYGEYSPALYFGTHTHSSGLFLGAALAVFWKPRNFKSRYSLSVERTVTAIGILALIMLVWALTSVNQLTGEHYLIGFPLTAIATTLLIASVVHPASRISKVLGVPILQWIGTRSYGLYLWHWIVIQVMRPGLDIDAPAYMVYTFQIIVMIGITEFSYRVIETPIRHGLIAKTWIKIKAQSPRTRRWIAVMTATVCAIPLTTATAISSNAVTTAHNDPLAVGKVVILDPSISPTRVSTSSITSTPDEPEEREVWVHGDSVMLGAKYGFEKGFDVAGFKATVAIQAPDLMRQIKRYAKRHGDAYDVILNLGVNGTLKELYLTRIFGYLKKVDRVVIINASVPRVWQDPNNRLIAKIAARYPNVRIADWALAAEDKNDYFASDGVHLTPKGVKAFIEVAQSAYLAP
jgi:peptidoglycan/LPS O-acetylase OafA/YrhL